MTLVPVGRDASELAPVTVLWMMAGDGVPLVTVTWTAPVEVEEGSAMLTPVVPKATAVVAVEPVAPGMVTAGTPATPLQVLS